MPQMFSVPRLLINRLRDVMAGDMEADTRLQKVVTLIAGTMVADVCSIYKRTEDDELELVATEGLSLSAVHQTRLALDEGLEGDLEGIFVAAALALLLLAGAYPGQGFQFAGAVTDRLWNGLLFFQQVAFLFLQQCS